VSTGQRTCIGLAAVALATVAVGLTVWRSTELETGEQVIGTVLLSAWALWPTLFHFDGLRARRFDADGPARTIAIVVACASALAWTESVRSIGVSTSRAFVWAPLVVLVAGSLTHRALRGERLDAEAPPIPSSPGRP